MIIGEAKVARTVRPEGFHRRAWGSGRGRPGKSAKIEIVAARATMQ